MMSSRGMGAIRPSKMPSKKVIRRKDNPDAVDFYAKGGHLVSGYGSAGQAGAAIAKKSLQKPGKLKAADMLAEGGKVGLYENIHKKRARISSGSGEKMRKPGTPGAPTAEDFKKSAKTAKKGR